MKTDKMKLKDRGDVEEEAIRDVAKVIQAPGTGRRD
jgi:hypothetical protein